IIYDPISSEFTFKEKQFNDKCPTILQVGTGENKNLENVIKAIKDIPCKLEIIGKLSSAQENLLNNSKINYINSFNLTDEQVRNKYIDSDIVVFASTYEGFGLPIIEAQATGRVVITSNIAPMNEVSGKGACLINPYDVDSIKNAVLKICHDSSYRNSLIEFGKKNVVRFSPQKIAKDYLKVYDEVLNENKEVYHNK
ncbi:glycosyltransferase, partial [Neobacillus drentensis]|uniref:glycosyltransferase n=1 Tax=Neobacillus drentensis TaxID=220684 RepID=UPI002FFE9115